MRPSSPASILWAILAFLLWPSHALHAQFYAGSQQEYGKSRVQYQEFLWQYYRFDRMEVYFYKGGRDLARYTALSAGGHLKEMERVMDFTMDERLQFVVYNSLTDFRQSNIGLGYDEQYNIGGVTRILGNKIFLYYEGDHKLLDHQIRSGIAQVMLDQMMFGGNWREVLKNSTLMSLPAWFDQGVVSWASGPLGPVRESRLRDGVLSGRFDKFNRLEGDDAKIAGHAIWSYVAEVYGPAVIPNILYMTRVSRNAESGFLFVLGVSLKTLTQECLAHYRNRFLQEDRVRMLPQAEDVGVRTRRSRDYSEFRVSPDGRYRAWVSNEMGQYKVWVQEVASGKVRRIIKGEKKLDRITDRSYPILAWHPTSKALAYVVERKGQLFMHTWTLDDRKTTIKPIFMLQKVLSMAYSRDGQQMVFSGVREGRTDLYLYHVIGNRQEQLTDDHHDDLDPQFTLDGKGIIFSSDRTNDTLMTLKDVELTAGVKDLFIFDLAGRSPVLRRLTETPDVSERQPMPWDSLSIAYLSDAGGLRNRHLLRYDSVVSHVDTVVHYRYFTETEQQTDLKRSILEHHVDARRGRYTQLLFMDGKYRFHQGRTADARKASDLGTPADGQAGDAQRPAQPGRLIPVVKVEPQLPPLDGDPVDVSNYVFTDERPGAVPPPQEPERPSILPTAGATVGGDTARVEIVWPQQRNYNVNFATDEVLTQLGNSYSDQFYQPFSGPGNLNPGLSALTRMGVSDVFEDHKIVGGFRLSLDLNNNDYMVSYENLERRLDRRIMFHRQAFQTIVGFNVLKLHTHQLQYRVSWPFSELASLRASLMYRHDRFVLQSTDPLSLRVPNDNDMMGGVRLEYVYDSSIPRGLNLYNGWKVKFFGEYYQHPTREGDMQVVGMDARHALRVHRDIIWVNRVAGSSSLGSRRIAYFLGGVDNWLFARVDNSIPIDFTQNYFYQSMAVPMRGFFHNARNGTAFALINSELRVPIIRYLVNRPIRSDFLNNLQVVGFTDVGTAWTGSDPYSAENSFNTQTIIRNPLTIRIDSQREPVIVGYGFGLRTRLLGYFVRADWGWGIDDGVRLPSVFHFSLSLDI